MSIHKKNMAHEAQGTNVENNVSADVTHRALVHTLHFASACNLKAEESFMSCSISPGEGHVCSGFGEPTQRGIPMKSFLAEFGPELANFKFTCVKREVLAKMALGILLDIFKPYVI